MSHRIRGLKISAALLLSLYPAGAFAQVPISVSGHVRNVNNKPIPHVRVTAIGEAAPTETDSSGLYLITLNIPLGQPAHFHLEHANYNVLDKTVAIASSLPLDFTLHSDKIVSPQAALVSLHGGLNSMDRPYRELDCAKPPCMTNYQPFPVGVRTKTDTGGNLEAINFVSQNDVPNALGSVLGTISLQDISKLSSEQRVMILVYEESIKADYNIWSFLSSQLISGNLSSNEKASTAARLVVAGRDLCGNFDNMLDILKGINIQVWDHYWGIKNVCDRFRQSHIGG